MAHRAGADCSVTSWLAILVGGKNEAAGAAAATVLADE